MKKFKIKILIAILILTQGLTSCLKKGDMNIDTETKTADVMTLQFVQDGGSTINSGMQYFSGAALTYPGTDVADTANYNVSLSGPATLNKDLSVTIGIDATKLLDNFSSDSIPYDPMPDSTYTIVSPTATIKAGTRNANMRIIFYPSKISIKKSYMLPIVVKEAGGQIISSNYSTIYFHTIGNPIAGAYTREWTRYNTIDQTGTPSNHTFAPVTFSPVNTKTISVVSGSAGLTYLVSFTNTNDVLSDFKVKFDDASVKASGVAIIGGPTIITADPINHKFVFNFTYDNLANGLRNITDSFQ